MSAASMLLTLAWLHDGQGTYPVGGSLPLVESVERRFLELGGAVEYDASVSSIEVTSDRATGVVLDNGRRESADWVISAADGRRTIFDLLGGRYLDDTVRGYYGPAAGAAGGGGRQLNRRLRVSPEFEHGLHEGFHVLTRGVVQVVGWSEKQSCRPQRGDPVSDFLPYLLGCAAIPE